MPKSKVKIGAGIESVACLFRAGNEKAMAKAMAEASLGLKNAARAAEGLATKSTKISLEIHGSSFGSSGYGRLEGNSWRSHRTAAIVW